MTWQFAERRQTYTKMLWSEREAEMDRDKDKARKLKAEVVRLKEEHVSSLRETLYELEDEVENM